MDRQVLRRPQVLEDLREMAEYIAADDPGAALRFLDAAEETFHHLAKSPELGIEGEFESPFLAGIRRWKVRGFDAYLIFYRPVSDGIEVIRVLHTARDIDGLGTSEL